MSEQAAYLLIHKIAVYNDEWYDDFTTHPEFPGAYPALLCSSLAEAQQEQRRLTREALFNADYHDLQLSEDVSCALAEYVQQLQDERLTAWWRSFNVPGDRYPFRQLSEQQLTQLIEQVDLKLFHILEADLTETELQEAQTLLEQTPERPQVLLGDEEQEQRDPAAERLNRVTALFGKRYITEIPV